MNGAEMYGRGSPTRLFFTIAIPGAISMIASSLWGLFDGIFVGRLLGETAFAALNLAFPIVILNFSLADLIGVGAAVNLSISLGEGDHSSANNCFTCACILITLVSTLTGALFFIFAPLLMELMGAEGELLTMAVQYARVHALASPFTAMIFAVDNFLRISGKIKSSMILNIAMSALILFFEYLCLAVFRMGISGSAFAINLGMFICTLIALYPFARGKLVLRFCRPRFSARMIGRIVACGTPNFLSNIAGRLTAILMNVVLLRLGGATAVSVYGVLLYVGDTVLQLLYGACDGLQPAIGYNWGARRPDRVKGIIRCCLIACALISLTGTALMRFLPGGIVALFVQEGEAELLTMATYAIQLYALTFVTRWFGFAVQGFLTALETPLPATILSVSNALIVPVLLLPLLWPLGLDGLWLNTPVTALLVSALALVFYLRLRKRLRAG